MSIPSQLPNITLAPKSGGLQSLSLRPQQVVQAVVIGPTGDGGTQVQVGRQTVTLSLPTQPPAGTGLSLQAQGSGSEQRLVLLQQTPPQSTSLAQPSSSQSSVRNDVQQFGLAPGQTMSATVLGPGEGGTTQVQAGRQVFNIVLPTPVPPGTVLTLQAQGTGGEQRLVIVQHSTPNVQLNPAPQATTTLMPEMQYVALAKTMLAQMVQNAVSRQDTMGGLNRLLASSLGNLPLPEGVAMAGRSLLALQMPLGAGGASGAALQKAILSSGIFQEALLAAGGQGGGDVKTALLTLRQALVSWIGPTLSAPLPGKTAPPLRGTFGRLAPAGPLDMDADASIEDVGRKLLDQTDSALARLRLHQHASLPEVHARGGAEWSMDLPVVIGPHQTMMQFQIHRDGGNEPIQGGERGWQMRFAIDLPAMGEVGAQVSLRAGMTAVMLWATRSETAAAIDEHLADLTEALIAAGLNPAAVHCRRGEPPAPPAASGHFMDKTT